MKSLILLTLLLSSTLWAHEGKLYLTTSYYDGLGKLMRVEKVVSYDKDCQEKRVAEVILTDKSNEIRELAYLDRNGIWRGFPGNNRLALKEITHLIKRASNEKNPCLSNADQKQKEAEKKEQEQRNLDELQEMPAPPAPVPQKPKAKEVLE